MSKWIGFAVSVNCGEPLGCYQGTILEADGTTITLTKAFRNGFPYPKSQVTLNAADIKDLKIIESRSDPPKQTHSTVAVTKNSKKAQRATVCENLKANPTSSTSDGNQATSACASSKASSGRSKPIDIQGGRTNKLNTHAGSYGNSGSTPKGQGHGSGAGAGRERLRRRDEACFGSSAAEALGDDFDFEGNLALFDKRALWERMRHAQKPDLVRQADDLGGGGGGRYRHDEFVLGAPDSPALAAARLALRLPAELRGPIEYVTDEGVVVPAVSARLRRRLREGMARLGLGPCADTLLARAAADVALRLVGGGRRLDPRNSHQAPTVVALAGAHRSGAAGLLAARLLLSHGARAACLVAGDAGTSGAASAELAALALSGVAAAPCAAQLPSADVVLVALHEPAPTAAEARAAEAGAGAAAAALEWARGARAALVALEPPAEGWAGAALGVRASVVGVAPCALAASLGRLYLADVAPPVRLFAEVRAHYRSPFGASPVLALYPRDEDANA